MRGWLALVLYGTLSWVVAAVPAAMANGGEEARRFYVRAALGHEWARDATFHDRSCSPGSRTAYFGCIPGSDGKRIGAYGDFGKSWAGELAIGVRALPALRVELAVSHRPGFSFSGESNFLNAGSHQDVEADVTQSAIMAMAFIDIAPLLKMEFGRFEPFVGGGAGIARNHISKVRYSFPDLSNQPAWTETSGGTNWDLAWTATAGTALRIAPHSLLEFSYRYSDYGEIKTPSGKMRVKRGGPSYEPDVVAGGTKAKLRSHGLYLGFRQEF